MSEVAIRVEGISKRYRIGELQRYKALRDTLADALYSPVRLVGSALRRRGSKVDRPAANNFIWALKDVSFTIRRGEVAGIIGRNGAGKSTLLKILSRITEPTSGYAEIRGRVGSLLEVGTGFHPELTGRENAYLNGAILGMKKHEIDRKFDEIVAFAEVERFIDTPVKHYSSGMFVRLAFAVAAHLELEVLLVDEVLAVGDAQFQKKCLGKLGEVSREGKTVLFVSHNLFSLENLCTNGILLADGQVAMKGTITEAVEKYLSLGREQTGEVSWNSPVGAPGNDRVRLKSVRIVSEGEARGEVDISKEFRVEVEYFNLQPNQRRFLSISLSNSLGMCLFTSANLPSISLTVDPWYFDVYPEGIFRTSCTIPGFLLNEGLHSISVFINGSSLQDKILRVKDVVSFTVRDSGAMREEFTGPWMGAVRPRLSWQTVQLDQESMDILK